MKISKEARIGIVVIATFLGFFFLFNFLKGKNLFVNGNVYYAVYDDVAGLQSSMPVYINGLRVGRVSSIDLLKGEKPLKFLVKLVVERTDIEFSKTTKAKITSELMGGSQVHLVLDYEGKMAVSGDTLQGMVSPSIMNMMTNELGPTKMKIDSTLTSLNFALQEFSKVLDDQNRANIKSGLVNLNETLKGAKASTESVTALTNETKSLITENKSKINESLTKVNELITSTQNTISKYGQLADKLGKVEYQKIINSLEDSSNQLSAVMKKVNDGDGSLGKLVNDNELYNNISATSESLNILLEDMKNNPSKYVQISVFGKKNKKE